MILFKQSIVSDSLRSSYKNRVFSFHTNEPNFLWMEPTAAAARKFRPYRGNNFRAEIVESRQKRSIPVQTERCRNHLYLTEPFVSSFNYANIATGCFPDDPFAHFVHENVNHPNGGKVTVEGTEFQFLRTNRWQRRAFTVVIKVPKFSSLSWSPCTSRLCVAKGIFCRDIVPFVAILRVLMILLRSHPFVGILLLFQSKSILIQSLNYPIIKSSPF